MVELQQHFNSNTFSTCVFSVSPKEQTRNLANHRDFQRQKTLSRRDHSPRSSPDFYDIDVLATPKFSPSSERTGGIYNGSPNSMQGDASNRATPARDRARPDNRRRQSNPGVPTGRSSGFQPQGYAPSPPLGPPNDGSVYSGPSLHYGATSGYSQNAGFFGQYTVPTQPALAVAQTPPYAYTHGFHPPGAHDSNMVLHDMQSGYQPMASQYHYPRPQENGASLNTLISGPNPSGSRFPSHLSPINATHTSSGTLPQSYMGSGYFSYSPAMGNPQYTYSQQFPPSPPVYSRYPPMQFPQHASSPREETQGTWYYLSHGTAPPLQYRYDGSQYQTTYTPPYPPLTRHPDPGSFLSPGPASGSHTPLQSPQAPSHPIAHQAGPASSAAPTSAEVSSRPSPTSRPSSSGSRPVARREWHPKPPPDRSPWVMWVGNVPSDATQEELWKFFNSSPADLSDPISPGEVVSIFLIARSNCAFINYASQPSLEAALKVFNGQRLRPNDPQCPMLVCKVRRSADDLKSGVGGQRGIGLHRQWVKEQRKLQSQRQGMVDSVADDASVSSQSALDHLPDGSMSLSTRDPETRSRRTQGSSSSGSYASTTSSFLGEHFPTRYFILKSLSENDLELSVQSGLWATQKHNELVLDRAFRTATDVFLIFSVNKSGEFYGYARMAGPIRQGEGSVSWSSLSESPTTSYLPPPSKSDTRLLSAGQPIYLSPDRMGEPTTHSIGSSVAASNFQPFQHMSAPANLGGQQDTPPVRSPSLKLSLDHYRSRPKTQHADKQSFRLDPEAPLRAMKDHSTEGARGERGAKGKPNLGSVKEGGEDGIDGIDGVEDGPVKPSPLWGDCFKVEWIERGKIPFHRTRHLRNAWNKGREIKVSRDGTELESSVGQRLLEEWGSLAESS